MPKLTIDHRRVTVPPGATVLDAARKLGIDIPTLCHMDGCRPSTSCLVCVVKNGDGARYVPACATPAVDEMQIESETDEVREVRRTALELLLSDHLGDCLAPCYFACPAQMDIPQMLRQIAAGQMCEAIVTVKRDIALPAVLGRICPAPCEKACRRRPADGALPICALKRFVADADLAAAHPYAPRCKPPSRKKVAIIGAGPTGLSAAYYLLQQGHACSIFDENPQPGGRIRYETDESQLPREVLDADIQRITSLGVELCLDIRVEGQAAFADLQSEFHAILIACGATAKDQIVSWGLAATSPGLEVDRATFATQIQGVFAAGNAVRGKGMVVRSVADGKEVAVTIDQFLARRRVLGPKKPFNTRIGRLEPEELAEFMELAPPIGREDPLGGPIRGFTAEEARLQASRCLHCDCRKLKTCRLRKYAALYGANPHRHKAGRRAYQQETTHPEVIFEPGKCIDCGLCIEIAAREGEPLGLTFIGRGFDVRVGVPLSHSVAAALQKAAAECVAACPTAALALKKETQDGREKPLHRCQKQSAGNPSASGAAAHEGRR